MAVKQATREGSTSSIMQVDDDNVSTDMSSNMKNGTGGSVDDTSLHRYLLDSTTHRRHSVIGALEFKEPVSSKDRMNKYTRETITIYRNKTPYQWLKLFLPCIDTLEGYQLRDLPIDLLSGFTVGAMVIPQGKI